MTKVVHQGGGYWLRDEFWQDAVAAGCEPLLVEVRSGVLTTRPITRAEFAARFAGRVSGWGHAARKSVSVFRDAHDPDRTRRMTELYREAVLAGLDTVAREFTARTGAQGRVRLPAVASFVVVVHAAAKDGSPHLHAHVAVCDQVQVRGGERTYATHKRELYPLRPLFAAAVAHHLAHRLRATFGVRVEKSRSGVTLPDVPTAICRRASARSKQIDDYLRAHAIKSTPLARTCAALVTRRQNPGPEVGRRALREELARTGFRSEQICRPVTPVRSAAMTLPSVYKETRRVAREARRLAKSRRTITPTDLLTAALDTARPRQPVEHVRAATAAVLDSPADVGWRRRETAYGRPRYVSRETARQWKRLARKVDVVLKTDHRPPEARTGPDRPEPGVPREAKPAGPPPQPPPRPDPQRGTAGRTAERSSDVRRAVGTALRAYRVIGAVGHAGVVAVTVAADLYQTYAKPVWRVHGAGHKNTPGSVAKMVRDLKPLPWLDAQKAAIAAMLKLNGSFDQKLRYGEHVYRQSRRAKFRVPRKCLVVVTAVGAANPRDVAFLLKKAERAKAKVLFVDREHSRLALLRAARSMKPGDHRPFPTPEIRR
ncbi:MAG: relaxase domain-containing protein [Gemmataceae bacterium]